MERETDPLGYDPFNVIYCAPGNYLSTDDIGANSGHHNNDRDDENHGNNVILTIPNASSNASSSHIAEPTRFEVFRLSV